MDSPGLDVGDGALDDPADPDRRTTGRQHLGDEATARIIEAYSEGGFEDVE